VRGQAEDAGARRLSQEKIRFVDELVFQVQRLDDGRFFSEPFSVADIEYWSQISYWTIDEAVALSFGKDPRVVNWARLQPIGEWSAFVSTYRARLELAGRAAEAGQIAAKTTPAYFLAWAGRTRFPMPAEIVAAVSALGNQIADWKTEHDKLVDFINALDRESKQAQEKLLLDRSEALQALDNLRDAYLELLDDYTSLKAASTSEAVTVVTNADLSTRERDTLLKMVIGLAIGGYRYDPKLARSPVIPEIANDLDKAGVRVSDDTVRKYLREGASHLPAKP
jgi:hypothetical protein